MTRWKKDAKEFTVGISYDDTRGIQSYIPKPIIEKLGEPESIKFEIKKNGSIIVVAGDES